MTLSCRHVQRILVRCTVSGFKCLGKEGIWVRVLQGFYEYLESSERGRDEGQELAPSVIFFIPREGWEEDRVREEEQGEVEREGEGRRERQGSGRDKVKGRRTVRIGVEGRG